LPLNQDTYYYYMTRETKLEQYTLSEAPDANPRNRVLTSINWQREKKVEKENTHLLRL
jgi:hypothetical protein